MERAARTLTSLDDDQRNLALARFELLRPHLEEGRSLIEVWSGQTASFRTAQRWVAAYHAHGLSGLVRQRRADRGQRRQISTELQAVAEGLALRRPPWSIAAIERELKVLAEGRGEPAPTYTVIYNVVRDLSPSLISLGREGTKRYRNRFDLVHRREADRPNEIWQADHTECDLWARRPDGVRDRPWLTLVVDDHSRAIAGFAFSFELPVGVRHVARPAPGDLAEDRTRVAPIRDSGDPVRRQWLGFHLASSPAGRRRLEDCGGEFHAGRAAG